MFLYLVGAVSLQCNILSGLAKHQQMWDGKISLAMNAYIICFFIFLFEYLLFEEAHLYTYDIFAEKVGFKLVWGCFVFYPCFYCIGIFPIALSKKSYDITSIQFSMILLLYFFGWFITRGANLQKFSYRYNKKQKYFFFIKQIVLPNSNILISGFWGLSRHLNYFGEILQSFALSLPGVLVGSTLFMRCLPLLYPLYYIILFVSRQYDDDELCERKYGELWTEYKRRVPYRIVPGIW